MSLLEVFPEPGAVLGPGHINTSELLSSPFLVGNVSSGGAIEQAIEMLCSECSNKEIPKVMGGESTGTEDIIF